MISIMIRRGQRLLEEVVSEIKRRGIKRIVHSAEVFRTDKACVYFLT